MHARTLCPICQTQTAPLFTWPYAAPELAWVATRFPTLAPTLSRHDFTIRGCTGCQLLFQELTPDLDELLSIYGTHAAMQTGSQQAIEHEISHQKLHWFAHLTEEILVMRQLLASPAPKVLDFGANWGKWASMALAFGCQVHAVELNPAAAAFCAGRGIRMLHEHELSDHRFDFIHCDQVVEHLAAPLTLLRTLAGCLHDHGYLMISTPQDQTLPDKLQQSHTARHGALLNPTDLDSLDPLVHLNLFTNHALRALGHQAGLHPVRLPFWKWMGAGQLWNLPRQLNRNLVVPKKRFLMQGTYLWFQKHITTGSCQR
ncbi:MAG: class I SAM-dependent methyltransferase [Magnetococcales bacterium]|nr:class I SAM-dependent methyltransferase [Magnetococcales bacterium]NGZ06662.1 class I SAM-dependent methyltransferase [Magnetococcales bacterium]